MAKITPNNTKNKMYIAKSINPIARPIVTIKVTIIAIIKPGTRMSSDINLNQLAPFFGHCV